MRSELSNEMIGKAIENILIPQWPWDESLLNMNVKLIPLQRKLIFKDFKIIKPGKVKKSYLFIY